MPDRPPPPALSDVALRETLDLLGQVVASMSARIDRQGEQIDAMAKAVEKTRSAAKREVSPVLLPSRQVTVRQDRAGRPAASFLAETGWCSGVRWTRVGGRPRPP